MATSLNEARSKKNDEFYTQLTDVAKELIHYKAHFKDKVVLCNCDDPTWSAFWKYFHLNFAELGLKKLISTHYDREEATYKMEYTGGDDNDIGVGVKTPLKGDGDFRNQECLDLLDECDIVVTNPSFSLFRDYVAVLMEHNKQFLVLGNINAITYKDVFKLVMENKIWLGYRQLNKDMYFNVPANIQKWLVENKKEGSAYKIIDNKIMGRLASACWYTNIDHSKRHKRIDTGYRYSKYYAKYDNYNIINVDKLKEIPMDYYGIMGVPITYMAIHNPEQYDILGIANSARYIGQECITKINGKKIYNRILIKKRPAP